MVLLCSLIALVATLMGCSSTQAVDDYAREHNIFGERVCNAQVKDVSAADVLGRGCPTGEISQHIEGGNQNEEKTSVQEGAL